MESTTLNARMTIKNGNLLQLFSSDTPNGWKVHAALEEVAEIHGLLYITIFNI
jgi:hypothetical protein